MSDAQALTPAQAGLRGRRVLVTGGTGFLGGHLVRRLVRLGAHVHVLARRRSPLYRIADVLPDVKVLIGDIRRRGQLDATVTAANPEIIFHLAAYGVDPRMQHPVTVMQTNVFGLAYLLDAMKTLPHCRLINTGTCFEYGNSKEPMNEASEIDPLNVYAASKTTALHLCTLWQRRFGTRIVTLRPFTFFGPWEREARLVPSVIISILRKRPVRITSGSQTRDYTYVEDMAEAFVHAAVAEGAVGQVINVGSGEDHPVREIVERIRRFMGTDVPVEVGAVATRAEETWRLCADPSRAATLLDWRARVTFEEGLERTVGWAKAHIVSRRA